MSNNLVVIEAIGPRSEQVKGGVEGELHVPVSVGSIVVVHEC